MHATGVPTTVVSTGVATTVVSTGIPTATVEPAAPAVSSSTSVTAAVLGKRGGTNQNHGSGYGEECFQQGGFPHFGPSTSQHFWPAPTAAAYAGGPAIYTSPAFECFPT